MGIIVGSVMDPEVWARIPDGSVHMVVTSPPYWALRDYGVEGQLGLEKTPEEWVEKMVGVFRSLWPKLRDDGTVWLNIGDSYAAGSRAYNSFRRDRAHVSVPCPDIPAGLKQKDLVGVPWMLAFALRADGWYLRQEIIWHKPNPMPESCGDRCTKSHESIFLLAKKPRYYYDQVAISEPTNGNAHARGDGVNPKAALGTGVGWGYTGDETQGDLKSRYKTPDGWDTSTGDGGHGSVHREGREKGQVGYVHTARSKQKASFSGAVNALVARRNKRSVWSIVTESYPGAHFATFPRKLVEPCVLAGTSGKGCCPECGAGWVRVVERGGGTTGKSWNDHVGDQAKGARTTSVGAGGLSGVTDGSGQSYYVRTGGWRPGCECYTAQYERDYPHHWRSRWHEDRWWERVRRRAVDWPWETVPATVFDPFMGAGTSAVVAQSLGREYLGIELNADYTLQAEDRIAAAANPTTWTKASLPDAAPLFAKEGPV